MQIINHRINTIESLRNIPSTQGVEIDIRSHGTKLILHHDPFQEGEDFEAWLDVFNHASIILNVKEEGLEDRLLNAMKKKNIDNFFFLDQSFPFLIKTARSRDSRAAVRLSEFESIETVKNLSGIVDWVWVDCFTKLPLDASEAEELRDKFEFKLCLVSPELQGRNMDGEILDFKDNLIRNKIKGDAVCTKRPDLWL
tara:strand:+ start:107 stop:697 length:591 start_codon:yes stop_codon:yes gene_type:complete